MKMNLNIVILQNDRKKLNKSKKYLPQEEDKMETLRKLDKSVELSATMTAVLIGLVGTLIFGAGMSISFVRGGQMMLIGIGVGLIGIVIMAAAFPVYKTTLRKRREKIAPQIIELSKELLK